MKDESRFNTYDGMINELDQKHEADLKAQEAATGNKSQVYSEVAKRTVAQREYEIKRERLVELREDARGVSDGVTAFLDDKPQFQSKMDVLEGKAEEDNSLTPLGGKQI